MISQSYFNLFLKQEQVEQTFQNGVFIDWFDVENERVGLFHYNAFIVQVYYSEAKNEIVRLEAIDVFEAAEKYIKINLTEII